jgi:hypothetical protein
MGGTITARVQCVIEVPVGNWGGGLTDLHQLAEQVRKEGARIVAAAAKSERGVVIGEPRVILMVMNEDS